MVDLLDLDNRRRILDFIQSKPGTHIREMESELEMQPGVLTFHLTVLKKSGLVTTDDDGYRVHYFPVRGRILNFRKVVTLLRQDRPQAIARIVLKDGSLSFGQLQAELGISKSTLSHHLKKLLGAKVLIAEMVERETFYRAADPDQLVSVLLLMDKGCRDDAEERFADIWASLRPRD